MRANPQKRPAFAGATDLRERPTDGKQMKLMPTTGLAMVHVGSPVQPLRFLHFISGILKYVQKTTKQAAPWR